jgi:hypothetical protein
LLNNVLLTSFLIVSILSIFSKVANVPDQRILNALIVRTLVAYYQNHWPERKTAVSAARRDIVYFLQNGTGLHNAKEFLKVLSQNYANQTEGNEMRISGEDDHVIQRKVDFTLSALPILTEIEAYLFPSRISDAIDLTRQLEATSYIPVKDKRQAWFLLLNYWNTRGELLNVAKNTMEYKCLWVPTSAYESVFSGFELILKDVIDSVEEAVGVDGAMTQEEADWILFHQLLVQQVILRFCCDREVDFDDRSALKISFEISALESGILGDITNEKDLSESEVKKKIFEILSEHVREPPFPSSLTEPVCIEDSHHERVHKSQSDQLQNIIRDPSFAEMENNYTNVKGGEDKEEQIDSEFQDDVLKTGTDEISHQIKEQGSDNKLQMHENSSGDQPMEVEEIIDDGSYSEEHEEEEEDAIVEIEDSSEDGEMNYDSTVEEEESKDGVGYGRDSNEEEVYKTHIQEQSKDVSYGSEYDSEHHNESIEEKHYEKNSEDSSENSWVENNPIEVDDSTVDEEVIDDMSCEDGVEEQDSYSREGDGDVETREEISRKDADDYYDSYNESDGDVGSRVVASSEDKPIDAEEDSVHSRNSRKDGYDSYDSFHEKDHDEVGSRVIASSEDKPSDVEDDSVHSRNESDVNICVSGNISKSAAIEGNSGIADVEASIDESNESSDNVIEETSSGEERYPDAVERSPSVSSNEILEPKAERRSGDKFSDSLDNETKEIESSKATQDRQIEKVETRRIDPEKKVNEVDIEENESKEQVLGSGNVHDDDINNLKETHSEIHSLNESKSSKMKSDFHLSKVAPGSEEANADEINKQTDDNIQKDMSEVESEEDLKSTNSKEGSSNIDPPSQDVRPGSSGESKEKGKGNYSSSEDDDNATSDEKKTIPEEKSSFKNDDNTTFDEKKTIQEENKVDDSPLEDDDNTTLDEKERIQEESKGDDSSVEDDTNTFNKEVKIKEENKEEDKGTLDKKERIQEESKVDRSSPVDDDYSTSTYRDLQALCKKRHIKANKKKTDLIDDLRIYDKENSRKMTINTEYLEVRSESRMKVESILSPVVETGVKMVKGIFSILSPRLKKNKTEVIDLLNDSSDDEVEVPMKRGNTGSETPKPPSAISFSSPTAMSVMSSAPNTNESFATSQSVRSNVRTGAQITILPSVSEGPPVIGDVPSGEAPLRKTKSKRKAPGSNSSVGSVSTTGTRKSARLATRKLKKYG